MLSCTLANPFTATTEIMTSRLDLIRHTLTRDVSKPAKLREILGVSQPTLSHSIKALGKEVVRIGKGKSIQYALRDTRGRAKVEPVYRVREDGTVQLLGELTPVHPNGFVMKSDKVEDYSDSLPWWLFDMHPQGYLGRAYAMAHAHQLGLAQDPKYWSDTDVITALTRHGHDAVGNLLIGETARQAFMDMPAPKPVDRMRDYPALARASSDGEAPGSSAGGEQPKFCTYSDHGHVIVKFTVATRNPISERWADLLLAEHIALEILGVATYVFDFGDQRFLEIPRFDRVGERGRVGMFSLHALQAQFVGGQPSARWPSLVAKLAASGEVNKEAIAETALRWAFGRLIGNSDMHNGNLSFVGSNGRPYSLSPAYDVLPMEFSPKASGDMRSDLTPVEISDEVSAGTWRGALVMAREFERRVTTEGRFSDNFKPCLEAIQRHVEHASTQIDLLP